MPNSASENTYAKSSSRILVVDDDDFCRGLFGDSLRLQGFEVSLAPNGRVAQRLCADPSRFDCILADYRMPEMDGMERRARDDGMARRRLRPLGRNTRMTQQKAGRTLSLAAPGDSLSTTVASLRQELRARVDAAEAENISWETLELNLATTRMIDSLGLNLLVAIIREMHERGRALVLQGFTRLDRHVELA